MSKVILIHANYQNTTARGDIVFAANIAKDVILDLKQQGIHDIDIILTSTLDGISRFNDIYGACINDRIQVEGVRSGLSSLETFDPVKNSVVAFIDANRCKHSPAEMIKRVLSPDSKILFVGNVNQREFSDLYSQTLYLKQAKQEQPKVYDYFDPEDLLIGSAGLGQNRLGLPTITKTVNLQPLSPSEETMLPTGEYGIMYLAKANISSLIKRFQDTPSSSQNSAYTVQFSVGCIQYESKVHKTIVDLLADANTKMYKYKRGK